MNAPPSIALAMMAMTLSEGRAAAAKLGIRGFWTYHRILPCEREYANPETHPVSAGYYAILDRLSAGEQP